MLDIVRKPIEAFLWNPRYDSAGKFTVLSIRLLRFVYALVRDSLEGQITLRAMSLVYTSLLSLVPLIALSFSILKGFGVHEEIRPLMYNFLAPLGAKGNELTDQVIGFVDNVKGVALGSLGLVFLMYSAISMVQKVEESLNFIWQVGSARSFGRRFTEYLSVIVIAPVLMAAAMGLLGSQASETLVARLSESEPFGTTIVLAGKLAPYLLVTAVFSFIYAFVPNTRVTVRAAIAGGLTAGFMWATVSGLFASFVSNSTAKYTAIYSTFAISMLALIWLYINWLILLVGSAVSFYYQNPDRLRLGRGRLRLSNRLRERLAVTIMYLVGADYRYQEPAWSINSLAAHLHVPAALTGQVVAELQAGHLLLITEDERLVPARDMNSISLTDILQAARHYRDAEARFAGLKIEPVNRVLDSLERAIKDSTANVTLHSLVDAAPQDKTGKSIAEGKPQKRIGMPD